MALNFKLRSSAKFVPVAKDVLIPGDFSAVANRFYYSYVNRSGQGIVLASTDGGHSWRLYDALGEMDNISARGPWVGWADNGRAVVYDINQQWRIADTNPDDPGETGPSVARVTPLPEIESVNYGSSDASGGFTATKRMSQLGIWDAPAHRVTDTPGGFTTTQRNFLGAYGDRLPANQGRGVVNEVYLVESWYLGSPSESYVASVPRSAPTSSTTNSGLSDNRVPFGNQLMATGMRGMEGTLEGGGVVNAQTRYLTHGNGIPAAYYSVRQDGNRVGLRNLPSIHGNEFEWANGGAWVDEYNAVLAQGAIGGHPGVLFLDSADSIVMIKRSGSIFGAWSEAKVYGTPDITPEQLWVPHAYNDVRCGVYGRGEAWFLIDTTPDYVPRGRLVAGDYLPPLPTENKVKDSFRRVTFW